MTRHLAIVSATLLGVGLISAPAMAAENGSDQARSDSSNRITLEPAPLSDGDAPSATSRKSASPASQPVKANYPPISQATVVDLSKVSPCKATTDPVWTAVRGPADVKVAGWAQCASGVWTFTAKTGSGHIGGMTLASDAFSGTIRVDSKGKQSGTMSARLPWGKSMLPGGKVRAIMSLTPAGAEVAGKINATDAGTKSSISLSGPVADSGVFNLTAQGKVYFAGSPVSVSGTYKSGTNAVRSRGAKPTWDLRGSRDKISFPGATLTWANLRLSSSLSQPKGAGQIKLKQYGLAASVALSIPADQAWTVTFDGSYSLALRDARLPGLTLLASQTSGSISGSKGRTSWDVRLPMRLVDGEITLAGLATMVSPGGIRLAPSRGYGDMFNNDVPVVFDTPVSSALLKGRDVSGYMGVSTPGESFVDMPEGWTNSTVLELTPVFGKSGPAKLDRSMRHVMSEGSSRITLAGDLPPNGPYTLTAGGYLGIGLERLPVSGSYTGYGPTDGADPGHMTLVASTEDADDKDADLGHGAQAIKTKFIWSTENQPRSAISTRAATLPKVTFTSTSTAGSKSNGTITLTVHDVNTSDGSNTVQLTGTWTYSNNKYTVTVKGTGSAYWEPYAGLKVPATSISGTIVADDSSTIETWNMSVSPAVTWDVGDKITLTTSLGMQSTCPQDKMKGTCPKTTPANAFWIWGSSSILNIPVMAGVTIPTVTATGAFLSDASFVRWDGFVNAGSAVEIDGPANSSVSMTSAQITMFSGATRDDTVVPPDLQMPDLSGLSRAKLNFQACGKFKIVIFDINTGNSQGCVAITPAGKVLGQSKTGGSTPSGDDTGGQVLPTAASSGGLTMNDSKPTQINGYGYSDIDPQSTPTKQPTYVKLYKQVLPLLPKQDSFTANINIPGSLMKSFGTGTSADTKFVATGWFKPQTEELYVDLDIPVNLKAAGAKLDDINLSLMRTQSSDKKSYNYQLVLDATGEVAIQSHHYPFDADITLKTGTANEAAVSLSVMGEASSQTVGNFDDPSLLTEGDFEPADASMLDGSFDSNQPKSDLKDGGFEGGTPAHNLLTNSSFEDSTSWNLLPDDVATMDGNVSGSTLANGSFDDTDVLINGDFEGVNGSTGTANGAAVPMFWVADDASNKTVLSLITGDAGPPPSEGAQVLLVQNNAGSASFYTGARQTVPLQAKSGQVYTLSGWARPDTTGAKLYVSADVVGADGDGGTIVNLPSGAWTPFSLNVTPKGDGTAFKLYFQSEAGTRMGLDNLSFGPTSTGTTATGVPGVARPNIVEDFDAADTTTYRMMSGSSNPISNGYGYLQTSGCTQWWAFDDSSVGYVDGDFDYSTTIYFPGNSREIANVGFYMDDTGYYKMQGYVFRIQTGGGDGGFYQAMGSTYNTGNGSMLKPIPDGGPRMPDVSNGETYRVHLMASGSQITADVFDVTNGGQTQTPVYTQTITLPSGSRQKGVFAQYPDGACSTAGHRWDDITISSPTYQSNVVFDPATAHSAPGYMSLGGTSSSWSYTTETDVAPKANEVYTYSVWLRSAGTNTMTGNLIMKTIGGTNQKIVKQPFTVGSTWTNVKVTTLVPADGTTLRVGVSDMSKGTLLADDATFQKMGWDMYAADNNKLPIWDVVADPTDSDNNVLYYQGGASGSAAEHWLSPTFASTQYHLSAKVRSATSTSVSGQLIFWDGDGSPHSANFQTTDDSWQEIGPINVTSVGGTNSPRISIEMGTNASAILVDDVTLTATETTSGQTAGTLGTLQPAVGWTNTPVLVNSVGNAHSGNAYLRLDHGTNSQTDMAASAVPGQSFAAMVWVKAPATTSTVTATLSTLDASGATLDTAKASINADGTYRQLIVTLPIQNTGTISKIRLNVANGATSNWVALDDIAVGLEGMTLVDPWVGSGSIGLVAVDDSAIAHSGTAVLRVTSKASSASAALAVHAKPTTSLRALSAWMKTADGSTKSVNLSLSKSGSSSAGTNFTVDGTWRLATVNLPVTANQDDTFTTKISLPSSSTILVDDVATRDVSPFVPIDSSKTQAVVVADVANSSTTSSTTTSAAASSGTVSAQSGDASLTTVAYEGFNYTRLTDLKGANGGSGWTSAWNMVNTGGGSDNITGGLTYPQLSTTGGGVNSGSGGNGYNSYGRNLPQMSTGVVYVQFLSNFGSQTGAGTPNLRLINSSTGAIAGGIGNNGGTNMAVLDNNLAPVATSATSMNANLMTIVRIDHDAQATSIWVNPNLSTFDYLSPPTPDATKSGFAPTFDRIEAYTRGGQNFDEITVMTAPDAPPVIPQGASSPPNALMVVSSSGGGVQAPTKLSSGNIVGGSTFTVRAHVAAAPGTTVTGTVGMTFGSQAGTAINPQLEDGDSATFTATGSWTQVTATFAAPSGTFTSFAPSFNLTSAGTLYVDTVTVTPVSIVQDQPWNPYWATGSSSQVTWGVFDDPTNAHDNSLGLLKMKSSDPKEAGVNKTFSQATNPGDVFSASVWARTGGDDTAVFRMEMQTSGGKSGTDGTSQTVTLTSDWQLINLRLPITKSGNTSIYVALISQTPGIQLYVDDVNVSENMWSTDDTATRTNLVGNSSFESNVGWGGGAGDMLKQSDVTSHSGGFSGELVRAEGSAADDYVEYDLSSKVKAGQTYTLSAYVWLPGDASASDVYQSRDLMWFVDYGNANNIHTTKPDFTKTMEWQRITTTLTVGSNPSPNVNIRFYVPTAGGWYVDDLLVESGNTLSGYYDGTSSSSTLSVVADAVTAYEGSGYARLSTVNANGVTMSANATGTMTGTQYITAYVRSSNELSASGTLQLTGGCKASASFTADQNWQKVSASCAMPSSGGTLGMAVQLLTPGGSIDVDSIQISNQTGNPFTPGSVYGVDSPLDHPESGYHYLWDDAFGIPGMHLWAFTIQVEEVDGEPGLGVQATVYQDPTKLSQVLYGTEWLQSSLLLNIDDAQPCFSFKFGTGDGKSGISVANGALKADQFYLAFAPRGCAVGPYKVPVGASVLFDAKVGDGTVHFDLALTKNAKGEPSFKGDVAVTQVNLGGIDYHDMEMSVVITPTDDSVSYVADMTLPMGQFSGDYNMEGKTGGGVHVDGSVELKNWGWTSSSGKGLKVNDFDFDFEMDVSSSNCGTLEADAKANANADFAMATKINFDGSIKVECGVLDRLHIDFDYTHGSITEKFNLDYNSTTLTLAGGVEFDFDRKVSWKALGYRYHRTSHVGVFMNFLMDVTKPQSSEATLGATIKVANGDGSAQCTVTGQPSDSCDLDIRVNSKYIGWVHFHESW